MTYANLCEFRAPVRAPKPNAPPSVFQRFEHFGALRLRVRIHLLHFDVPGFESRQPSECVVAFLALLSDGACKGFLIQTTHHQICAGMSRRSKDDFAAEKLHSPSPSRIACALCSSTARTGSRSRCAYRSVVDA